MGSQKGIEVVKESQVGRAFSVSELIALLQEQAELGRGDWPVFFDNHNATEAFLVGGVSIDHRMHTIDLSGW